MIGLISVMISDRFINTIYLSQDMKYNAFSDEFDERVHLAWKKRSGQILELNSPDDYIPQIDLELERQDEQQAY